MRYLSPLSESNWSPLMAAHLGWRMGFGESVDFQEILFRKGLSGAVESYLSQAIEKSEFGPWAGRGRQSSLDLQKERLLLEGNLKKTSDPKERKEIEHEIQRIHQKLGSIREQNLEELSLDWISRMNQTTKPFSQRLLLFWHNFFAISAEKVEPHLIALYLDRLQSLGLSRWGEFLLQIAREPAMLVHLDNLSNTKSHPNENFARELMELFSLGVGSYSEEDVRACARAFTGWSLDHERACFVFHEDRHDGGVKLFLGKEGNWNGEAMISILLEQPEAARFLARKILSYFVYENPEIPLIDELSDFIRKSKFDLRIIFKTIFESTVFYSDRARGTQVKSPVVLIAGTLRLLDQKKLPAEMILKTMKLMGMDLIRPADVNGWPSGYQWINTSTLLLRYNFMNLVIHGKATGQLREKGGGANGVGSFDPHELLKERSFTQATEIVDYLLELLIQRPLQSDLRIRLVRYLETDQGGGRSTFDLKSGLSAEKIKGLIHLILSSPDYQLC